MKSQRECHDRSIRIMAVYLGDHHHMVDAFYLDAMSMKRERVDVGKQSDK